MSHGSIHTRRTAGTLRGIARPVWPRGGGGIGWADFRIAGNRLPWLARRASRRPAAALEVHDYPHQAPCRTASRHHQRAHRNTGAWHTTARSYVRTARQSIGHPRRQHTASPDAPQQEHQQHADNRQPHVGGLQAKEQIPEACAVIAIGKIIHTAGHSSMEPANTAGEATGISGQVIAAFIPTNG